MGSFGLGEFLNYGGVVSFGGCLGYRKLLGIFEEVLVLPKVFVILLGDYQFCSLKTHRLVFRCLGSQTTNPVNFGLLELGIHDV